MTALLEEEKDITIVNKTGHMTSGQNGNEKEAIPFIIWVVGEPSIPPGEVDW